MSIFKKKLHGKVYRIRPASATKLLVARGKLWWKFDNCRRWPTKAISAVTGDGCVTSEDIKLRKSYRGTQVGTVLLPAVAASKFVAAGKLVILWVKCRIRIQAIRFFRYLEIGYTAKGCKKNQQAELVRPLIDNGSGTANKPEPL